MNPFWLLKHICDHRVNRHRRMGAVVDFVDWQIRSRLAGGPIEYAWIGPSKVLLRRGETGFTMNIYCGLQDLSEMSYLLHVLRSDDLFVDIGANIGAYTLLAGAVIGTHVICFEPVPETYARLTANLQLNHLEDRVSALNAGVGEETGRLRFSTGQNCENHVLGADENVPAIEVEILTLDGVLAGKSPALLKIDVEGFELAVLQGATSVLHNPALHSILMEVNIDAPQYGHRKSDVLALVEAAGFSPHRYDPFARELSPVLDRQSVFANTIYVRDQSLSDVHQRLKSSPRFRVKSIDL